MPMVMQSQDKRESILIPKIRFDRHRRQIIWIVTVMDQSHCSRHSVEHPSSPATASPWIKTNRTWSSRMASTSTKVHKLRILIWAISRPPETVWFQTSHFRRTKSNWPQSLSQPKPNRCWITLTKRLLGRTPWLIPWPAMVQTCWGKANHRTSNREEWVTLPESGVIFSMALAHRIQTIQASIKIKTAMHYPRPNNSNKAWPISSYPSLNTVWRRAFRDRTQRYYTWVNREGSRHKDAKAISKWLLIVRTIWWLIEQRHLRRIRAKDWVPILRCHLIYCWLNQASKRIKI